MCTHECLVDILRVYTSIIKFYVRYIRTYLCDSIGLVLACLLSGITGVTGSSNHYMTQPSGIPILSPVLLYFGDLYIPPLSWNVLVDSTDIGCSDHFSVWMELGRVI